MLPLLHPDKVAAKGAERTYPFSSTTLSAAIFSGWQQLAQAHAAYFNSNGYSHQLSRKENRTTMSRSSTMIYVRDPDHPKGGYFKEVGQSRSEPVTVSVGWTPIDPAASLWDDSKRREMMKSREARPVDGKQTRHSSSKVTVDVGPEPSAFAKSLGAQHNKPGAAAKAAKAARERAKAAADHARDGTLGTRVVDKRPASSVR